MAADQSTPSSSRINFRSSLPAPSSVARKSLLPKSMNQGPPSPSSPATQAKQSLAEAIANNDPARYRSDSASPTTSSQSSRLSAAAAAAAILPPKSNLAARKSLSGLKPRSETPTNPISRVQSHQLSPTTTSHTRRSSNNTSVDDSAGSPSSTSAATRQSSPGTGVDVSRAKSPLMVNRGGPSGISTPSRFQTPKRFSDVSMKTIPVPPIPGGTNYTTSTIASKARQMEPITSRRGRELEIGDHVRMEGTELTGVLRHLGPVQFKPGYYAGLELTGDSVGKGKNDGSVGGVQYFACTPGNGMFCPASKVVAMSEEPPTEATARPQSAMSNRSARSSDVFERPPSTTPSLRKRASTLSRPPSTTPSRASSRASVRPASTTPASRPASALSHRPTSRLAGARRSLGGEALQDDYLAERRSRQSAEKAAEAEKRITEGSRAHKFLGMTAKDLERRRERPSSPAKGRPSSPLKDSLFSRTSSEGRNVKVSSGPLTPGMPRARQSMGAVGIPTPRAAAKPRSSMFGRPSEMLPPSSPSKEGRERPASALSRRTDLESPESEPSKRRSFLQSDPTGPSFASAIELDDASRTPGSNRIARGPLDKNRMLLEELDLTPRRPTLSKPSNQSLDSGTAGEATPMLASHFVGGEASEAIVEPVVPLSLYEQQSLELDRLKAQVETLEKSNHTLLRQQEQRKARASEIRATESLIEEERAKMRAEARERETEMEEDRKLEREDEVRRRKEVEAREKETRERLEVALSDLRKANDEANKVRSEQEARLRDVEAKLCESEKLVADLKSAIESKSSGEEADGSKIVAKQAEIDQLRSKVERLETELERERAELGGEIDELKDAGREAISLYEQRIEESEQERLEIIEKMKLLESHAQQAIADAERQKDEAIRSIGQRSQGASGATEIDNENLREQVDHLQEKVGGLEDQVAEAQAALEKERENLAKRKGRAVEAEEKLKAEVKRLKGELEKLARSEADARERVEELHEALEESKAALESERAEVEGLRADVENLSMGGVGGGGGGSSTDDEKRFEKEKARMEAEIERVTSLLEGARSGKREANKMAEELRRELKERKEEVKSLESEKISLSERVEDLLLVVEGDSSSELGSVRRALEEKSTELEMMKSSSLPLPEQVRRAREAHEREMSVKEEEIQLLRRKLEKARQTARASFASSNGTNPTLIETASSSPTPASVSNDPHRLSQSSALNAPNSPRSSPHHDPSKRTSTASTSSRRSRLSAGGLAQSDISTASANQVSGLNYLVRQLTDENVEIKNKHKVLEVDLKEKLEEAQSKARVLEITVNELTRDLERLEGEGSGGGGSSSSISSDNHLDLVKLRKELAKRTEEMEKRCLESEKVALEISKRLQEAEREKKREVQGLNKEVAELEALVEARIFREDELENEIERLKRKLERERGKGGGGGSVERVVGGGKNQRSSSDTERSPSVSRVERKDERSSRLGRDDGRSRVEASNGASSSGGKDRLAVERQGEEEEEEEDFCGLCSKEGHSLIDCDQVGGQAGGGEVRNKLEGGEEEACDDCGETGHVLEECPYAAEIF